MPSSSHCVMWVMPILSTWPSAKINVYDVLKTYITVGIYVDRNLCFVSFTRSGREAEMERFSVYFHFSSITLTQGIVWMTLVSQSSKYMKMVVAKSYLTL